MSETRARGNSVDGLPRTCIISVDTYNCSVLLIRNGLRRSAPEIATSRQGLCGRFPDGTMHVHIKTAIFICRF